MEGSERAQLRSATRSSSVPARYPQLFMAWTPKTGRKPNEITYCRACSTSPAFVNDDDGDTKAIASPGHKAGGFKVFLPGEAARAARGTADRPAAKTARRLMSMRTIVHDSCKLSPCSLSPQPPF